MPLSPGSKSGAYEIIGPLGAGGMGEVYRAKDPTLGREVAIKILPALLAADPEHLARFEREARLLASLSHPAIAIIHGIERGPDGPFLVLELVEGQTLAQRLTEGPLPASEALDIGRQIADGLAAAHDRGVIHRDLKPANVMITPQGRVKILDFGLARSAQLPSGSGDSVSPTMGVDTGTHSGVILGTPAYMSPEQARGKPVDKRTDLWSFGCLLYETLSGRKAFGGETATDCLVAVLEREPNWSALPASTPQPVRHLLQRCLEKDPNRRLRDASDARLEIDEALAGAPVPEARRGASKAPMLAAAAVAALVLLLVFVSRRERSPAAVPQPRLSQLTVQGIETSPAWSRSGARLAYSAEVGNRRKIFVRGFPGGEDKRLTAGDFDDIQPAWSADDRTILFVRARKAGQRLEPGDVFGQYDDGDVWSVDVGSGKETLFVEQAFNPSFSPDGKSIAVDASWAGPRQIWVVDAQGHNPRQITSDVSEAVTHVRPRWSPDGRRIVFQNIERTKFDIRVADVASKVLTWITNDLYQDIDPIWSPSGRFIYFSSNRSSGGLNLWRAALAADGTPVGAPRQVTTGAGQDIEGALSPDGRRLALAILKQNADIWRLPVSPETGHPTGEPEEVVATTREDSRGAWSPDGKAIAFNSDRSGDMNIWLHSLSDGSTRQITSGPGGDFQSNWSPDGRWIAFFSSRSGNADLWKVDVTSGKLVQLTKTPSLDINPSFSPDGRRIAYQSDQGGRLEVWVATADGGEARQLTHVGVSGHFMRWTRDGRAIVFRCPTCGGKGQTLQVPIEGGDPRPVGDMAGGAHISFSPDFSKIMDVTGHKTLWVSPLGGGAPEKVFEFSDPRVRIDYPVWSPDGRYVLFDRFRPQGGDIWIMEGFE